MSAAAAGTVISGHVEPGWQGLASAFEKHFADGLELGAALCVYHRGRCVLDLHGGIADAATGRPWTADTLVALTSVTKMVLATLTLLAVQRGELDLHAPVARYWPEFAAEGKDGVTLAMALSHSAGIPAFPRPVTLRDQIEREPVMRMLIGLRPLWTPGTAHGYHAITLGFLLTELLRRRTGSTEGQLAARELAGPLGIDLRIGLPADQVGRVAAVVPPEDGEDRFDPNLADYCEAVKDPSSTFWRATFGSSAMTFEDMNDVRYYTTERPAGGYATAAAVATLAAAMIGPVGGIRLFDPATTELARTVRAAGTDHTFRFFTAFGLGFMLPGGPLWPGNDARAFGHIGSTGALAFADPEQQLAFAYLPNRMKHVYEFPDRRATALVGATYAAAQAIGPAGSAVPSVRFGGPS